MSLCFSASLTAQKGDFETKINFIYIVNFNARAFSITSARY